MKSNHSELPAPCASARRRVSGLIVVLLGVMFLPSLTIAGSKGHATKEQSAVAMKEIILPIEGMSCVACVARVKKELSAMPGVSAVNVDLVKRNARIRFDPKRVSAPQIVAAVNKLGYKAGEPADAAEQNAK